VVHHAMNAVLADGSNVWPLLVRNRRLYRVVRNAGKIAEEEWHARVVLLQYLRHSLAKQDLLVDALVPGTVAQGGGRLVRIPQVFDELGVVCVRGNLLGERH